MSIPRFLVYRRTIARAFLPIHSTLAPSVNPSILSRSSYSCTARSSWLKPLATVSSRSFAITALRSSFPSPSPSTFSTASSLTTSTSISTTTLPSKWSIEVVPPSEEAIKQMEEENGVEAELVPWEEARIEVSEAAWNRLTAIARREKDPTLYFRVAVDSGGCHGYQYKMDLTNDKELDDYVFNPYPSESFPSLSSESISDRPLSILIDPPSLKLLKGCKVDYTTELIGSAFRIKDNPQAKGSGCGCGVSWEAV
ncbi:Mitochondrial Fe-S cluster biosynthesis protein ISA2 (contains a HesB-like domain) [Phaffia rhodozyma]|uniref:Mitochondrial Fe-S cluster biosynthesis protein ISA2 (Contains a HesB-like domain) n=1 Tax=Phaffia rhodozyma TaxID=264483 RepID=A0A0F7SNG5_PHARH|nr:Mitochondrial Fe-S cluster biosynthesis protein ISA2 (contains a HesB-like domain) [Phaffia rhodozyma]